MGLTSNEYQHIAKPSSLAASIQTTKTSFMPDKSEKERRKQIMEELRKRQTEEFESSLPMSRDLFQELFNYLDKELEEQGCDDTLKLTEQFLKHNGVADASRVTGWLSENGGYCDCEVLANVEEKFEN